MQELRSTEVLDREIQSDARKKAENILSKADADAQSIIDSVETKVAEALQEKEVFFAKKLEAVQKDLDASLPLEKERFKVSFIEASFINKINDYLQSLSEEKRIELVAKDLDAAFITNSDMKVKAYAYGFSTAAVKKAMTSLLGKSFTDCEKTEFGKMAIEDDLGLKFQEGIILESEDKNYRCRLTLIESINHVLDKYRSELSDALFS